MATQNEFIYETPVSTDKLHGFLQFLNNLNIPSENISYTLRGDYQIFRIDLTGFAEHRETLGRNQITFL